MAKRKLEVVVVGDTRQLSKALGKANKDVTAFGKVSTKAGASFGVFAKGAGLAGLALGTGLTVGVKRVTTAFAEAEKVTAQTNAVLKSTGEVAKVSAKDVDKLATSLSLKSGVDDEVIKSGENVLLTFTKIRNETGRGNKVFDRATKAALDMSVALGTDLQGANIQVGKALNDPIKGVTALQRVGVSFTTQQREQITTLVESGNTLKAQKLILRELTTEFGGSAKAAGQTTAGAFGKLKVAVGNAEEAIGGALAPTIARGSAVLARFVTQIQNGTGAGGRFAAKVKQIAATYTAYLGTVKRITVTVFGAVVGAFNTAKAAVTSWVRQNKQQLAQVGQAFRNIGKVIRAVAETVFPVVLSIAKRVFPGLRQIVQGTLRTISGIVKVFSGVLTGDFRGAWQGVKQIFSGALKAVTGMVRAATAPMREAASRIAKALKDVIKSLPSIAFNAAKDVGVAMAKGVADGIKSTITGKGGGIIADALKLATPGGLGSAIGKAVGDGVGRRLPSLSVAGLDGADPDLAPFAAIGASHGLRVSDGLRPSGTRTSSGGISYHGSGDAIDLAGSSSGMMATFRELKNRFGGKLRELIYTPGGVGIKDGRPFRYTGKVAADHNDHVHVAYTGPFGDGPGRGDGNGVNAQQLRIITEAAKAAGIDPAILYGLYGAESNFGRNMGPSSAGALGPFQFMPSTAAGMGVNPLDFKSAAFGAAKYLGQYKGRGTAGMLAAYNAGPAGNPNNPETQAYIPKVLDLSKQFNGPKGLTKGLSGVVAVAKKTKIAIGEVGKATKGLGKIKADPGSFERFQGAIQAIRDQVKDLASEAAGVWRQAQEKALEQGHKSALGAIANSAQAQELAAIEKQAKEEADAESLADLNRAIADAKYLVEHSGGREHQEALENLKKAEDALEDYKRDKRADDLRESIESEEAKVNAAYDAQVAGLDAQESAHRDSLARQLGELAQNLALRKISYTTWAQETQAILAGYGLAASVTAEQQAALQQATATAPVQVPKVGNAGGYKGKTIGTAGKSRVGLPGRAHGGPVRPYESYLIGEDGPEVLRMGSGGGAVIPNHQIGATKIEQHFHGDIRSAKDARIMANRLAFRIAMQAH